MHQAAEVGVEQLLQFGLAVSPLDGDVLLLHLAEQPLDPALELSLQFGAIDDENHGAVSESRLVFKDLAGQRSAA